MTGTQRSWLWWTLGAAAAGILLRLLGPVLTPFLFSALLAYVASPLVARLERRRVPRAVGVTLVFALFTVVLIGLIGGLIPVLQNQVTVFAAKLPGYLVVIQNQWLPWIRRVTGVSSHLDMNVLKNALVQHWRDVGSVAGLFIGYASRSGAGLARGMLDIGLIPVVTFYLLRDWDRILARAPEVLPKASRETVIAIARETDRVLAALLRGQLSVMLVLAMVYSVGLWMVGVELALPIGLLAGFASFVPYLGFITGLLTAGVAAWLQFQDVSVLLWVGMVFGIGQVLESMVLTPHLVGGRIGVHPVAVIFAVMAGGQLFGFMGVLLALPGAAILAVAGRHFQSGSGVSGSAAGPAGKQ
ncbi:MAG: AI-2E family transporter [Acidiferrobacterales bacterium]